MDKYIVDRIRLLRAAKRGEPLTGDQIEHLVLLRQKARDDWHERNDPQYSVKGLLVRLGLMYRDDFGDAHLAAAASEWPDVVEYVLEGKLSKHPREYPTMRKQGAK